MKSFCSFIVCVSFLLPALCCANSVTLNYVPPASNVEQQGVVRVTNANSTATIVSLIPIDDSGNAKSKISFSLNGYETKTFNSSDLEYGNSLKGLSSGFGQGEGNWRIVISTDGLINAMALVRSPSGFLNSVHDISPSYLSATLHEVAIFNPAKNPNQLSKLRLSNNVNESNSFDIVGVDDTGAVVNTVSITVPPLATKTLNSIDLEQGNSSLGLIGSLGSGNGKWRLVITSSKGATVLSMMELPGGYISNLSSTAVMPAVDTTSTSNGNITCADISGASVFSQEDSPVYLGFFGTSFSSDSINNKYDTLGNSMGAYSVRNTYAKYGSSYSSYGANNKYALYPPVIVKKGKSVAFLSINNTLSALPTVSLATIDSVCTFYEAVPANPFVP
jgi:hypothetical protein